MNRAAQAMREFALFWWDFVVGDDWMVAGGVIVALVGTAALHRADVPAWWLLPVLVAVVLGLSLARAVRSHRGAGRDS